jgi:GT2 family glycosyltransferase
MSPAVGSQRPVVTTVVMTRNRRDELLANLPRYRRPVIVVDNASTDGTPDAVATAAPDVSVVRLRVNSGAQARNIGVLLARTPYVAFSDDDSWWQDESLDRAAEVLDEHPSIAALAARIVLRATEDLDPLCAAMADSPLPDDSDLPGLPVLGFAACGVVVRRDAFLASGGFDRVVFFAGEESRLAIDMAVAGFHLRYLPELVAHHNPSPSRTGPDERAALIARNRLLTAVMRRPWSVAVRQTANLARTSPGRRALAQALPRLPIALADRRRVPAQLEDQLRLLGTL